LGQSSAVGFRFVRWSTIAFALALFCVLGAARAEAAPLISGQQEVWPQKEWGTGNDELENPVMLGVDSSDGSVYIGDTSSTFENVRIQKFTANGEFKAATAGIPSLPSGVIGVAVDPDLKQFYVLTSQFDEANERWIAEKILVFSTEPVGEELVETGVKEISLPTSGPEALISPNDIVVDPQNDQLVIPASDEAGHIVIEMVNHETGATVARYTETGSEIEPERFGIAVDSQGLTYVVTGSASQSSIRAYTLPVDFGTPLSLTPVPGFEAAATSEEWPTSQFRLRAGPELARFGPGHEVAVDSTPTGDMLYFKTERRFHEATEPGVFYVHGYSVAGEATSVIYGGGVSEPGECAVQTPGAALGVGPDESLVVLDQGEQVFEETFPSFFPQVVRFGPQTSGLSCPVPAAALELLEGSTPVSTVETGKTVTMDGSESDFGSQTLTEMTWTVEDSAGNVVFTESKDAASSTTSIPFDFTTPGDYIVRLKVKTSAPTGLGNTVSTARTLTVTGGSATTHTLGITKTGTGTGTVTCKVDGGTAAACPSTVDDGDSVEVIATPDTGSELGAVSGTGSAAACTTAPCTFTANADGTVSVEFKLETTPPTTHTLGITKTGTGTGTVTCKIDGGTAAACPSTVDDGDTVEVIATPDTGSELGAVSGTGSAAACTTAPCTFTATADSTVSVEFKAQTPPPPAKHKVTITKAGDGSGSVKCDSGECGEYAEGTEVTLTATADSGSTFTGWSGANCSGTGSCTVKVGSGDVTVTATFSKNSSPEQPKQPEQPKPTEPPHGSTPPSNVVKPGAVKPNSAGASLTVTVPGPGTLAASGKGVVTTKVNAKGAGPVQLKLKLTSAEKKTLAKKGKVTIKVKIVFTPTGGTPGTSTKTITFKAKAGHGKASGSVASLLRSVI
jgi:hypothetical protein